MSKARPSLREQALAKPRRIPGPKRTFRHWFNALPDDVRAEVVDLLDDPKMEAWRVSEVLAANLGYEFGADAIGKWRRGEYATP